MRQRTDPGNETELTATEADEVMASYRAQVRGQTQVAGEAMTQALERELKFAVGRYTMCTDDGSGWSYDSQGRFDAPAAAERPYYKTVRPALEKLGFTVEERPEPSGDARLVAEDLRSRVTTSWRTGCEQTSHVASSDGHP